MQLELVREELVYKGYRNVEGVARLSSDTLVAISVRRTNDRPKRFAYEDQSLHIFRIA